jgi:TolA-binding protein
MALACGPALAQRQPPTPEQRLDRLERQLNQLQRQVFPKGRPADTAGFSDEPAATQSSVATLDQRLDALERQMSDMLRLSEENGHRLQSLEADLAKVRSDEEQRIQALEQRVSEAAPAPAPAAGVLEPPVESRPSGARTSASRPTLAKPVAVVRNDVAASTESGPAGLPGDPGEEAYTQGFRLWEAGNFDQAITSLRSFTKAYPKHRRVSYANNLIGRSLLSKGDARGAAQVFLANYRGNPAGDRAGDSLYYLGQAETQLGQPGQACRVYAEFDAIYGAKARADLKKQVSDAKAQAQCG